MKIIRNDKGFMLVLTLVVISVISIFFLTFIQMSVTQNKQVEHTSDIYEVTSVAEMGVEYFDKIITQETLRIITDMKDKIDKLNAEEYESVDAYYSEVEIIHNKAIGDLIGKEGSINQILDSQVQKKMEIGSAENTFYMLNSYIPSGEEFNLEIIGKNESGKEKLIRAKIEIPIGELFAITRSKIELPDGETPIEESGPIVHDNYTFDLTLKAGQLMNSNLYVNGVLRLNLSTQKKEVKYLTLTDSTIIAKSIELINQDKKNNIIRIEKGAKFCLLEKTTLDLKSIFQITGGENSIFILDNDGSNLKNHGNQIVYLNSKNFKKECKVTLDSGGILPNPDTGNTDEIKPVGVVINLNDESSLLTAVNY